MKRSLCLLSVLTLAAGFVHADVKLPAIFDDHLVLQRGKAVAVWGTAEVGEEVTVTFADQTKKATADKDGAWKVALDKLEASAEGRELKVKGKNEITFKDVLVGEVWICSGQSNMGMTVARSLDAEKEIAAANDPQLRMFHVQNTVANEPQKDLEKKRTATANTDTAWLEANPKNVGPFTAAGYFFGRELRKQLNVPVGLINTSWGGTRAEAWTSKPALEAVPECKAILTGWEEALKTYDSAKAKEAHEKDLKAVQDRIAKIKDENAKPGATPQPLPPLPSFQDQTTSQHRPAVLFNAMISPLVPYTVKGAIWYQGESNQKRAVQYETLLSTMIKDWRKRWGDEFSFYIVQLASFGNSKQSWPQPVGADDTWAELQWAQFRVATKPKFNAGLAVANDIGEEKDIHPKNKQEVGRRLALQALVKDYKKTDMLSGGPVFAGGDQVANRFVINFSNGTGLKARDGGEIQGFIICGEDKVWKPAKAKVVEGRPSINVSSPEVKTPVAVRYAWSSWCPEANLVNKDGLPASCFRTDKFDLSTKGMEDPFKEALPKPAAPAPEKKDETKKEEVKPALKPDAKPEAEPKKKAA